MQSPQRTVNLYRMQLASTPSVDAGMAGFWGDAKSIFFSPIGQAIDAKSLALENALKLITVLSSVAAIASVLTLVRARK